MALREIELAIAGLTFSRLPPFRTPPRLDSWDDSELNLTIINAMDTASINQLFSPLRESIIDKPPLVSGTLQLPASHLSLLQNLQSAMMPGSSTP